MKRTYLVVLYVSLLAGLEFPDFDLHLLIFLGHRSILTHGIIVPFFLYKFLTKEGYSKISNKIFGRFFSNKDFSREILDYAYIGFLIGIAIHLCADLFPKAWMGFALIVFPPWIPMGAPFSIVWMLLNMFFALKISFQKIKEKEIENKTKNRIFLSILAIGTIYLIIDTMFVSKIILMIISFPIIWFYANKGFKVIKKKD
tara:strand:- start:72 stop:671 length:600 start_codon:yes stop_codon:yes gene_type:complete